MRWVVALASPVASTTSVNRECEIAASSTSRVFSLALAVTCSLSAVGASPPEEWSGAVWIAMVIILCLLSCRLGQRNQNLILAVRPPSHVVRWDGTQFLLTEQGSKVPGDRIGVGSPNEAITRNRVVHTMAAIAAPPGRLNRSARCWSTSG